jgi:hypothetical protein
MFPNESEIPAILRVVEEELGFMDGFQQQALNDIGQIGQPTPNELERRGREAKAFAERLIKTSDELRKVQQKMLPYLRFHSL